MHSLCSYLILLCMHYNNCYSVYLSALANKPGIAPKPSGLNLKKSSSVDKVTSPVNKVASPEKPLPSRVSLLLLQFTVLYCYNFMLVILQILSSEHFCSFKN